MNAELELITFEIRGKRGDLIQFLKILNNIDIVEFRNKPSDHFREAIMDQQEI